MSDHFVELFGTVVKEREFPCGCSLALVGRNALAGGGWVSDRVPAFIPCAVHADLVGEVRSTVAAGKPGDPFDDLEAAMVKVLPDG